MKNIKLFNKILLSIGIIFIILILILFILGNIERKGYLSDISINIEDTLKLNNVDVENTKKLFYSDDKLDYSSLTNYIFTNSNISKYSYNFRIKYYSKIFGNSDIYGVYLNTNILPEYIFDVLFHEKGSPFGILVSSKIIGQEKIDNIQYSLRLKFFNLFTYLILFYIFIILLYIFRKFLLNIFHYIFLVLKKYKKLLLIYFIIYILLIVSLFIFGRINRDGYLSEFVINADDTLKLNNVDVENTKKLFYSDDKLYYSSLTNYIFTNSNISKYSYNFRIKYYSKVFRNSDIYGVYLDTGSLPDYISNVKFHEKGSPFGVFTSNKKILENIDNVKYNLKIKLTFLLIILILFIGSIIFIKLFIKFLNLYKINHNYKYYSILIIFLCFLIMPNIIYTLFEQYFDKTNYENRLKAEKPDFNITHLNNYSKEYEQYFNDNLPFRNELIKLNNFIDILAFKNIISDEVLLGKDDWFFYKGYRLLDKYIGVDSTYLFEFTDEELEYCKNSLIYIRDELKKRNIDFILMICPDKDIIYSQYIPDYIKRKTTITSTDRFVDYMKKNTDIKIVYPKSELLKYKEEYQLYYKYSDYTHWNKLGGFIGYRELVKELGFHLPDISSLDVKYTNEFQSYYLKKLFPLEKDYYVDLYPTNKFDIINTDKLNDFFVLRDYLSFWNSPFGSYDMIECVSYNYLFDNKIAFVRDSYFYSMFYYVAQSFKNSIFINKVEDFDDMINKKPNVVVFETVERALNTRLLYVLYKYNEKLSSNTISYN